MSSFTTKPILIRRGEHEFFVPPSRAEKFIALPRGRWAGYVAAHYCAGKFFVQDADGTCRACRIGGACRRVSKVAVRDITHATLPRAPGLARPQRPDDLYEREELRVVIANFPGDLGHRLQDFAAAHWDSLTAEEISELLAIVRSTPAEARTPKQTSERITWHWVTIQPQAVPVTSITLKPDRAQASVEKLVDWRKRVSKMTRDELREQIVLTEWRIAPAVAERVERWLAEAKVRRE